MTETPDDRPTPAEPHPEPATEEKRGVNDPDPEGTDADEPLTSL